MKKLFAIAFLSATVLTAQAQPKTWLLYGNINATSLSLAGQDQPIDWSFSPGIGYQMNKNWTVGINLNWTMTFQFKDAANDDVTMNTYHGGPFVRYSCEFNKIFNCYTQLDLNYIGQYRTPGDHPSDMKAAGFGATVWTAIGINIGNGWAVNVSLGSLGFSSVKRDTTDAKSDTKISFNYGIQNMMIGLSKNLGGKYKSEAAKDEDDDDSKGDDSKAKDKKKKNDDE